MTEKGTGAASGSGQDQIPFNEELLNAVKEDSLDQDQEIDGQIQQPKLNRTARGKFKMENR